MYITINNNKFEVILEQNSSVIALINLLKEKEIVYTAHEYGGFEIVGRIGFNLPQTDKFINTQAGDIVLYQGNQISIFYGSNSWSYTKIGKIKDFEIFKFKKKLESNNKVTISIH